MRALFVMDPLDKIRVDHDSTYVVMREWSDRGWSAWWCTPDGLGAIDGEGTARAAPVRTTAEAPYFHEGDAESMRLGDFDVVWMRKDPPFDMSYIFATYLLDMAPPSTLVVNDPIGLKLFNEKLWAMRFPQHHPKTLLSRHADEIKAFVKQQGRAVLKPWDGNGGRGVLVADAGDRNLNSMIELLTGKGREAIVAQAFVERADEGDKRILLFDGEPVGAILRVPGAEDYRGNMDVGARVEATELDDRERAICETLAAPLRDNGQIFVGIDVIDGMLTEINVTSPTGLQEVNELNGLCLEADLVDRVVRRLEMRRKGA